MKRTPVAVVVQTHWDREWYYPRETYAARLVRVMQRVVPMLEQETLKFFLLDGQTAALEDLRAESEPELILRVETLIRAGRILLGPWYISADEFLVSGESLLRNLEQGTRDVAAVTSATQTYMGYLPDTFGHIAQMPLILAQFGIGTAVLWRGADAAQSEFDWEALDGTTLPTLYLSEGYYQHPLNVPDFAPALLRYLDTIAPRSLANHFLLTQGGDHLAPHADVATRIAAFNEGDNAYELQETTLPRYAEAVVHATHGRRSPLAGELRHNKTAFVLPDVLSTRRYLKHAHQVLEDRLLGEVEPLLAAFVPHNQYPWKYLNDTWRSLIQNQAHDSICGCSVDSVHREMAIRFEKLNQRCDILVRLAAVESGGQSEALHEGGPAFFADDSAFTLFNPLPHAAPGPHFVTLFLQGEQVALNIRRDDSTIAHDVMGVEPASEFHSPLDDFPDVRTGHRYRVALHTPLAGLSAQAFFVTPSTATTSEAIGPTKSIANARYRVSHGNGTLTLQDGATQTLYPAFASVMSELDAGDTYNFSPPPKQTVSRAGFWVLKECMQTDGVGRMLLEIAIILPAGLDDTRHGASDAQVTCNGTLEILLPKGEGPLTCHFTWTNRACDQRTRLVLPWRDADVEGETWSDTGFAFFARKNVLADYPLRVERREMTPAVQPSLSTIVARPFVLHHRALHEYEVIRDRERHLLAITLVRSVGWMSRRDLVTRGVGAGPDMPTPEAQCLITDTFDFTLSCLAPDASPTAALIAARALRRPVVKLRGVGKLGYTPFTLADARVEVSSLRRVRTADGQSTLELRLWNPMPEPLTTGLADGDWLAVRADGTPIGLPTATIAPFGLLTLRQRTFA